MSSFDEIGKALLRDKLLGRWAAGKLGKLEDDASAYVEAFVASAKDGGDVFSLLQRDFMAAGQAVPDSEISEMLTRCAVQAGALLSEPRKGFTDTAAVALARNFASS